MQLQHHVNAGFWPRGKDVAIQEREGQRYLQCALSSRHYELAAAYTYAPYADFMNLVNDQDLQRFVRAWGPLRLSPEEKRVGLSEMRLDWCWAFQRRFRAFGSLLETFGKKDSERARLREFLAASQVQNVVRAFRSETNENVFLSGFLQTEQAFQQLLRKASGPYQALILWLEEADSESIRGAVAFLIKQFSFTPSAYLMPEGKGYKSRIFASLGLECLEDALEWMIWNSYWQRNPLIFCRECRKAIRSDSAHKRKYCGYDCAHRVAARKWRRKDLKRRRKRV